MTTRDDVVEAPAAPESRPEPAATSAGHIARRTFVVLLAATALLAPLALAGAQWPQWWSWIASEQTPMTWLQSVVLVVAASIALLIGFVQARIDARRRAALPWLVLAAGFAALAVDERFAVHERVRDRVLAPRGVEIPFLPWIAPGDFLILGVGVLGLLLLPVVWRAVRLDPASRTALLVGVALSVVAIGMDSIDPTTMSQATERLEQTLEECVELAAGLALLGAMGLRLLGLLDAALPARTDMSTPDEQG